MANYDGEMYGESVTFTFYTGGRAEPGWYITKDGIAVQRVQLHDVVRGVADPKPAYDEHKSFLGSKFNQYKQYIQNLDMSQPIDEELFLQRARLVIGFYNAMVEAKKVADDLGKTV